MKFYVVIVAAVNDMKTKLEKGALGGRDEIMHNKILLPYTGDKPYIFVSYKENDKDMDVIYKIILALQEKGYRIWYDNGSFGKKYKEILENMIQQCEILLCFLSEGYVGTIDCKWQLNYAKRINTKIVPILIDDSEASTLNCIYLKYFYSEIDPITELVNSLCEKYKNYLRDCLSSEEEPAGTENEENTASSTNPPSSEEEQAGTESGGNTASSTNPPSSEEEPAGTENEENITSSTNSPLSEEEQEGTESGGNTASSTNPPPSEEKTAGTESGGNTASSTNPPSSEEEQEGTESGGNTASSTNPPSSEKEPEKIESKEYKDKDDFCEKKYSYVIVGGLLAAVVIFMIIWSKVRKPSEPQGYDSGQAVTETAQQYDTEPKTIEVVDHEKIIQSCKKATEYLADLTEKGCPLSVYDPRGSEEDETLFVYDNAIAALALLSEDNTRKSRSDNMAKQILDAIIESETNGDNPVEKWDSKSLAAASIALLQYDKSDTFKSYVDAAERLLKHVEEKRRRDDAGFNSLDETEGGTTEENLWLYAAFNMLYKKTGNKPYSQSADHALAFVLTMRSGDGAYYLAGNTAKNGEDTARVSVQVQALAALILNDRTGMQTALSLQKSGGGFAPDNRSSGGFGTECTALMSLACGKLGLDEKKEQALSSVYHYQMEGGSIPKGSSASLSDGTGKRYSNIPNTSATAWYAMAAAEYNPFEY